MRQILPLKIQKNNNLQNYWKFRPINPSKFYSCDKVKGEINIRVSPVSKNILSN